MMVIIPMQSDFGQQEIPEAFVSVTHCKSTIPVSYFVELYEIMHSVYMQAW